MEGVDSIPLGVAALRLSPVVSRPSSRPVEEASSATQLTEEEQRAVQDLKARDREVRAHEQAHKLVGGQYAGAISYDYTTGPDGRQYVVGGEVPIDIAPEEDPQDTVRKMEVVIAAALAPAEPTAQDRAVARQAVAQRLIAQADLRAQKLSDVESEIAAAAVTSQATKESPENDGVLPPVDESSSSSALGPSREAVANDQATRAAEQGYRVVQETTNPADVPPPLPRAEAEAPNQLVA